MTGTRAPAPFRLLPLRPDSPPPAPDPGTVAPPAFPPSGSGGEDSPFRYRDGVLHAEALSLHAIARRYGTPCYVYSRALLEARWRSFDRAFSGHEHLICFAVKANGNLAVLDVFARLGSGFDIVSEGELARVLAAGGLARRVVFSGCGKSNAELRAALEAGIRCFNVESLAEIERLSASADALGVRAAVSLRVNPDIDARTHPYVSTGLRGSKFGVPIGEARGLARRARGMPGVDVVGVGSHIGSQQTSLGPFRDALAALLALADALHADGIRLGYLNVGGGMGVRYRDETVPGPADYAAAVGDRVASRGLGLLVEPGRALVAEAGALLTRVEYRKRSGARDFLICDAAMNDLLRPALYDAWHEVQPVDGKGAGGGPVDVVGPVCESADFLARERRLGAGPGDLLAVRNAGAYAFVMSSNYNARPRAAEVMVDGARAHLVRPREEIGNLFASESRLPRSPNARSRHEGAS